MVPWRRGDGGQKRLRQLREPGRRRQRPWFKEEETRLGHCWATRANGPDSTVKLKGKNGMVAGLCVPN
jgi:hypothetical protein